VSPAINVVVSVLRHRLFSAAVVLLVCLAGAHYYLDVVSKIYPVDTWLFWVLIKLWAWLVVFSVACVCGGHWLLERVLRLQLAPLEALVQSMTVGVVGFVMCMYAGGALRLYGPVFAVALPAAFIVLGARSALQLARRLGAEWREPLPSNPFVWLLSGLGACCVGMIYLGALTPDSLNYDSTWSHLVIAQDYAREGRIIKFHGNYNMGVPHLASLVHTWDFTVPGLERPAVRWMMALHTEFALFCWTLVGVAAGARRLLGESKLRGAWVGFFLFPIIFVYDNNLGGAADHVAAFFVVPLLLAACELWDSFSPRAAALLAISAAGAMLTKYQALYLFVPLALLLAGRWSALAWRVHRRALRAKDPQLSWRELIAAPLVLVGVGALLVSPHFLKNAIFYHNPLYPFAQDVFSSVPSAPNAGPLIRYNFTDDNWRPKGTALEKFGHALQLFFTFSFKPHYSFTRDVPAFGSLYTLLLPLLLVLRSAKRIWLGAALSAGALLIWAYTYNVDRNLQIFMPIMVCVTVALIVRIWQLGWLARAGLVPLVLLQVVWGGDALFYSGAERMQSAFSLIRSGYDRTAARRFDNYRSQFLAITDALPRHARVLLHTSHVTLGIDREVVMDWDAYQGFISYDGLSTVRELYDYLKARGITHLLLEPRARVAPTKQEEVLFNDLLSKYAEPMGSFGSFKLYRFPTQAPPATPPYRVVTVGLSGYADGSYAIKKLNTHEYLPGYVQRFAAPDEPLPSAPESRAALLGRADAVLVSTRSRLDAESEALLKQRFSPVIRYEGSFALYVLGKGRRSL
jgi:hypothetical protein